MKWYWITLIIHEKGNRDNDLQNHIVILKLNCKIFLHMGYQITSYQPIFAIVSINVNIGTMIISNFNFCNIHQHLNINDRLLVIDA